MTAKARPVLRRAIHASLIADGNVVALRPDIDEDVEFGRIGARQAGR